MREDDSNWFARCEEELPTPDELMPISQTLITPDLALAFDIRNPGSPQIPRPNPTPPHPSSSVPSSQPNSAEFDSAELGSGGGTAGDEPPRTLKRPRLVWTPQLHKRFVDAVAHLGIKNAVPKTIMQLMSVDGLTRENVASHLQKYRLYLKRMQGLSAGGGGGLAAASADSATDQLFASSPVPPHFLHPGRGNPDHYLPFVPVAALQQQQHQHHHHHHQQMVHPQLQPPQYHHHHPRQVGHFGLPPNGQFEHPFLLRQSQPIHRMGAPVHSSVPGPYVEDLESATATAGRKVLTLFPSGDD